MRSGMSSRMASSLILIVAVVVKVFISVMSLTTSLGLSSIVVVDVHSFGRSFDLVFVPVRVMSSSTVGVRRSDISWLSSGVSRGSNNRVRAPRCCGLTFNISFHSLIDLSLLFSLLSSFFLSLLLENFLSCFFLSHFLFMLGQSGSVSFLSFLLSLP